jgi:hypothetical protein
MLISLDLSGCCVSVVSVIKTFCRVLCFSHFCLIFAARSVTIFMVGIKKKIEDSLFKDAGPSVKTLNKQSRKELRNEARAAYWAAKQAQLQPQAQQKSPQ